VITAKDLENTVSLSQYIAQGRIMGVADSAGYAFSTRKMSMSLNSAGGDGSLPPVPKLSISLDGMILTDFSLADLPVSEVESIEVLLGVAYTAAYGSAGANGILVITTKRGSGRSLKDISAPGIVIFMPKGYDIPRQFYSPKYETDQDKSPDLRTTVYWNPNIVTDANGNAKLDFYNPSKPGKYRILIEGINADGDLARRIFNYQVN
jgi:hypothetical protein